MQTQDVMSLTNETLKMSKISGLDYANATDYMTTAIRGFKMELSEANTVVDVYSALAASTAVSTQELAEAMTRTASSMESVGSSFQETSAMMATVIAVTRESANNIGSAFKSIASRYGEMKSDPSALVDSEGEELAFNKVDAALKSVGITMKTTDGQFRSFTEVIMELADRWDTLTSVQQRYIATQFAGNRQQSRFLALVSNKDLLQANLQTAQSSEDAGTLQVLKTLDSLETKIEQVRVAYQQFYTTMGIENVWKTGLDALKSYINTLNSLPKLFGKIPVNAISAIMGIVNLLKGVAKSAIDGFARSWVEALSKAKGEATTASDKNLETGHNWAEKLMTGIKNYIPQIRATAQNAVREANAAAASEINKQNFNNGQNDSQLNRINALLMNQGGDNTPILDKNDLDAWGYRLDYVKQQYTNLGFVLPPLTGSVEEQRNTLQKWLSTTGQIAPKVQGVTDVLSTQAKQTIKAQSIVKEYGNQWSQTLNIIGSAISSLTLLADTTTRNGEILAGAGNMAGGITSIGAGILAAYTHNWPMAISSFISGLSSISSAIGLFYETTEERVEKLTKRAEELSNESKKSRAEANQLDTSLKKYNQLLAKRNESEEAANEFSDAVNDLADQFPQLIIGFDDAGNAIIDVQTAEALLTLRRQEAAKAALDAATAESDRIKGEQEKARETISNLAGEVVSSPATDAKTYSVTIGSETKTVGLESNTPNDLYNQLNEWFNDFVNKNDPVFKNLNKQYEKVHNAERTYSGGGYSITGSDVLDFYYQNEQALTQLGFDSIESLLSEEQSLHTRFRDLQRLKPEDLNEPEIIKSILQLSEDLDAYYTKLNRSGEAIPDWIEELQDADSNWSQILSSIKQLPVLEQAGEAADRLTAFYKISQQADQQIAEHSELVQLASEMLYDDYVKAGYDWDKVDVTAISTANQLISDFWEDLNLQSEATAAEFLKRLNNPQTYRAEDVISFVSKVDEVDENVQNAIIDYMEHISFDYGQAAIDAAKEYTIKGKTVKSSSYLMYGLTDARAEKVFDTQKGLQIANNEVDLYTNYLNRGLEQQAQDLQTAGRRINLIMADASDNNVEAFVVMQNLLAEGWDTTEDVTALKKKIEDAKADGTLAADYADRLISELDIISATLIDNYLLSLSVQMDNMSKNWEADLKEFKTLSSGMSFAQQQNLILQAGQLGVSLNSSDFIPMVDGQVKLTDDALNRWLTAYYQDRYDSTLEVLSSYNETVNQLPTSLDEAKKFDGAKAILAHMGLDIDSATQQDYSDAIENWNKNYSLYINQVENLQKMREAQIAWMQGDYGFESTDAALDALKQPVGTYAKDSVDLQKIVHLREAYNTFLNDLINEPFNEVSSKFESGWYDIDTENNKEITKLMAQGEAGIKSIVSQYAAAATQTIEEQNELIAKAIEAAEKKNRSLESATADVQWVTDKLAYASMETATAIANALGVSVDEIIGAYDLSFGAYELHFDESQQKLIGKIDNIKQPTYDSVISYIEGITDVITSGMKGNLKGADISNLAGQLDSREIDLGGYDNNLTYLWNNVQRTTDGLKLSKEATVELYNQLKQIDAIQAQLVFKEMVDSTKESDQNYRDLYSTLTRIKKIEEEIAKINKQREQTPASDKRLKMLQAELEVAKQINTERLLKSDDSWDFMNADLPASVDNIAKYWNNLMSGHGVLNKLAAGTQVSYEDFFNVVRHMYELAKTNEQDIQFFGETITGEVQSYIDIINKVNSAVESVDGQLVINPKTFGTIFDITGLQQTRSDFNQNAQDFLQGEKEKVDQLIKIYTYLAKVEDISESWTEEQSKAAIESNTVPDPLQTMANAFIEAAEFDPTLKSQLEEAKINDESVWDILNDLTDWWTRVPKDQREKMVALIPLISSAQFSSETAIEDIRELITLWLSPDLNTDNLDTNSLDEQEEKTNSWFDKAQEYINSLKERAEALSEKTHKLAPGVFNFFDKIFNPSANKQDNKQENVTTVQITYDVVNKESGAAQLVDSDPAVGINRKININFGVAPESTTLSPSDLAVTLNDDGTQASLNLGTFSDAGVPAGPFTPDNVAQIETTIGSQKVSITYDGSVATLNIGDTKIPLNDLKPSNFEEVVGTLTNSNIVATYDATSGNVTLSSGNKVLVTIPPSALEGTGVLSWWGVKSITYQPNSDGSWTKKVNMNGQIIEATVPESNIQGVGELLGKNLTITYNGDVKSISITIPQFDENGNVLKNEDGQPLIGQTIPIDLTEFLQATGLLTGQNATIKTDGTEKKWLIWNGVEFDLTNLTGSGTLEKGDCTVTYDETAGTIQLLQGGIPVEQFNFGDFVGNAQGNALLTAMFLGGWAPGANKELNWANIFPDGLVYKTTATVEVTDVNLTNANIDKARGWNSNLTGIIQRTAQINNAHQTTTQTAAQFNKIAVRENGKHRLRSNGSDERALQYIQEKIDKQQALNQAEKDYLVLLKQSSRSGHDWIVYGENDDPLDEYIDSLLGLNTVLEEIDSQKLQTISSVFSNLSLIEVASLFESLYNLTNQIILAYSTLSEYQFENIDSLNTKWETVQATLNAIKLVYDTLNNATLSVTVNKPEGTDLTQGEVNETVTVEYNGVQELFASLINSFSSLAEAAVDPADKLKTIEKYLDNISKTKADTRLDAIRSALIKIPDRSNYVNALQLAMNAIPDVGSKVQAFADALIALTRSPLQLSLTVDVEGAATVKGTNANVYTPKHAYWGTTNTAFGGIGRAKGTLMGELGPELYVQGGRYYVAGQNGAEFVNLADDAIVFNHLQTKKLLENGNAGRGKPVTNEKTAVAWATGNSGLALAGAKQTLADLQALSALLNSLINQASKNLGQKAGKGSGGGGGGGGGSALNVTTTSKELETWYNLLQQIERIEAKITYQEQLRSKLESDRIANGKAYYASQKASLQALTDETQRHAQLAQEYSEYRDKLINALTTDSFYKQFYMQDEATGAIQYNAGAIEKMKRLQDTNSRGQFLHSAQEQFEIVMRDYGLTTDSDLYKKMITNDDGTQQFIMEGGKYYKTKWDEKAGQYVKDSEMTAEELTTAMEAVMEKFWTEMDATRDEITEVQKQVDEQENAVLESEEQRNELLQEIEDNMIDVQQKVYDAVEHLRQEAIDELQEQRDILADSNQAFIDGLNEQLTQEREMYSKNESDAELTKLQRQLAILQRSGGSASAIRALQDQINSKQQDMYFDERQAQIDAIQKASDNELERLDRQIELMEESLTYDKENGLLWNEVAQILTGTPEQIAQYIHENSDDYRTKSATEQEKINREDNLSIQQYTAYRDDKNKPNLLNDSEHDWEWYSNYIANTDYAKVMSDKATQNAVRNAFEAKMKETGDENQAREAANAVLKNAYDKKFPKKATEPIKEPDFVPPPTTSGSSGSGSSGSGSSSSGNIAPPVSKKEQGYVKHYYRIINTTTNIQKPWTEGPFDAGKEIKGKEHSPAKIQANAHNYNYVNSVPSVVTIAGKQTVEQYHYYIEGQQLRFGYKFTINGKETKGSQTYTTPDEAIAAGKARLFAIATEAAGADGNEMLADSLYQQYLKTLTAYKQGGLANYTGLAMVHGSKRKPEAFIDADTTRIWKEKILNGNNSLTSLLANLQEHWSALPTTSQYESINSSTDNSAAVNIENATVEMHVDSIANDYDARRAGQSALEEIMKIARKSGTLATNRG